MAKISEILKQEYKTKGTVSGLSSAVVKRLREKIDPRNIFFGGTGVGSQIGRNIFGKGYSAVRDKPDLGSKVKPVAEEDSLNNQVLGEILKNTNISAKNSVVLPYMARDMNLTRLNIMRLVKLLGGKSTRGTDMFFKDAKDRENIYESQFKRTPRQITPSLIGKKEDKKENESIIDDIIAGTLLTKLIQRIVPLLFTALTGPVAIAGLVLLGTVLVRKLFDLGEGVAKKQKGLLEMDLKDSIKPENREKLAKKLETITDLDTGEYFTPEQIEDVRTGKKISYRKVNPLTGKTKTVIETPEEAIANLNSLQKLEGKQPSQLTTPEIIKQQEKQNADRTKEALKDAPFLTRTFGYKEKEFLASKGLSPKGSPMPLTGEVYEEMATNLIRKEEGLPKNGKAYRDASGYSIGYGHFITPQEMKQGFIQAGDENIPISSNILDTQITKDQAEKLLMVDMPKYVSAARVPLGEAWFKLSDQQKAALIASAYNTGQGGIEHLVKKGLKSAIMSGNTSEASRIIKEHGFQKSRSSSDAVPVTNPALVSRRAREAELFAGDELQNIPTSIVANKPNLEPTNVRMPASTIEKASIQMSDEKTNASKSETPVLLNAPVTNNNVTNGGGNRARGYDTSKSKVYDTDLINLLQRTA